LFGLLAVTVGVRSRPSRPRRFRTVHQP